MPREPSRPAHGGRIQDQWQRPSHFVAELHPSRRRQMPARALRSGSFQEGEFRTIERTSAHEKPRPATARLRPRFTCKYRTDSSGAPNGACPKRQSHAFGRLLSMATFSSFPGARQSRWQANLLLLPLRPALRWDSSSSCPPFPPRRGGKWEPKWCLSP